MRDALATSAEFAEGLSAEQTKLLEPLINKGGHMNPKIVGKAPHVIASMAGFRVPETTTVLLAPYEKVGPDAPLSIKTTLGTPRETAYELVGSSEADPTSGKISTDSPIGKALQSAKEGDVVDAATPRGSVRLHVLAVSRS